MPNWSVALGKTSNFIIEQISCLNSINCLTTLILSANCWLLSKAMWSMCLKKIQKHQSVPCSLCCFCNYLEGFHNMMIVINTNWLLPTPSTGSFTRTALFNMLIKPFKMSLYKVKLDAKFHLGYTILIFISLNLKKI